jgi:hypothetical protein
MGQNPPQAESGFRDRPARLGCAGTVTVIRAVGTRLAIILPQTLAKARAALTAANFSELQKPFDKRQQPLSCGHRLR